LILVADDNSVLLAALVATLESAGHRAFGTSDGKSALAYAREHPIALLITDLVMPGQEGMETIRQFVKEFPHLPIIAMSGKPEYLPSAKLVGAAISGKTDWLWHSFGSCAKVNRLKVGATERGLGAYNEI
jgi:CheY-like chemotaxis protein